MPNATSTKIQTSEETAMEKEAWFRTAEFRWPKVKWPKTWYFKHLDVVAPHGSMNGTDVFLSGASGFQIEEAWDAVHVLCASRTKRVLAQYRVPDHDSDDLWAEAMLRLARPDPEYPVELFEEFGFRDAPAMIVRFDGSAKLQNYILLVAKRIAHDGAKRRRLIVTPLGSGAGADSVVSPAEAQAALSDHESRNKILAAWVPVIASLSGEDRMLFGMVYLHGLTRQAASEALNWDDPSRATRRLQKVEGRLSEASVAAVGGMSEKFSQSDRDAVLGFLRMSFQVEPKPSSAISGRVAQDGIESSTRSGES